MAFVQSTHRFRIEKWYPYLDRQLVEYLISIPATQLLRPGERRSLMRRALVDLVPPEILSRKTKATTARSPIPALQSRAQSFENIFRGSLSATMGYVDDDRFREALRAAVNGNWPDLGRLLKGISLELWLRDIKGRGLIQEF